MEQSQYSAARKRRQWYFLVACLGLLVVLAVAGNALYYRYLAHTYFPAAVRKEVHFALYYPVNLPSVYTVDSTSYQIPEQGILTFNVISPSGVKIGVSEQALPDNLDLAARQGAPAGVRLPTQNFGTSSGQATIDQWGANKVCYVIAGQTWIILNVTGLQDDQVRLLARSFVSVQ